MEKSVVVKIINFFTWHVIRNNKDRLLNRLVSRFPPWVTPNLLIYLRILVALILLILFLEKVSSLIWWLISIYFIGKISDLLDGSLARWRKQTTFFGEIFDPLSDRLLNLIALVIIISLWHLDSLRLYFFVNLGVIIMLVGDLYFILINKFSFRFIYFRKTFEAVGLLATIILLIIELIK